MHPLFRAFIAAAYKYRRQRIAPLAQADDPEEAAQRELIPERAGAPAESQYSRGD